MADMPLPIVSSAAQAGYQAREVASEREARATDSSNAANRQNRAVNDAGVTVDTADADARVFNDAEGTGSQGRDTDENHSREDEQAQEPMPDGVIFSADGSVHIDLQA